MKTLSLQTLFIAASFFMASSTLKGQTTVNFSGFTYGYDVATTFLNGSSTSSNLATGLYNVSLGNGSTRTVVCMQPDVYLQNGALYDLYLLNAAPLNSVIASQVGYLIDNFYSEVSNLDESVGFQLAFWEVAKDGFTGLNYSTGKFVYDSSSVTVAANDFAMTLLAAAGATPANYQSTANVSFMDGPCSQDLIGFELSPTVPEPAGSILVLTAGLLGFLRRRR